MEKFPFLGAVDEAVGGVEVEDDFFGVFWKLGEGMANEEGFDKVVIGLDFVRSGDDGIAVFGLGVGEFEAVEGGLSGEGAALVLLVALKAEGVCLSHAEGHDGIAAQGVVVIEVLIAHGEAENALAQELAQAVDDIALVTEIAEAMRELVDDPGAAFDLTQQHNASICTEVSALEIGFDFSLSESLQIEVGLNTVCHAAAGLSELSICLNANTLLQFPVRPRFLL